jgi:hypothetical protein
MWLRNGACGASGEIKALVKGKAITDKTMNKCRDAPSLMSHYSGKTRDRDGPENPGNKKTRVPSVMSPQRLI